MQVEACGGGFGLGARDDDGDACSLFGRVDGDVVERRLALDGLTRHKVEPEREAFVSADEADLFDDAVGQAPDARGELPRLAQSHVLGTKDEFDQLSIAEARGLCAGGNRGKDHPLGDERSGIALGGPVTRCGIRPGAWSSGSIRGRFGAGNVLS